MKISIGYRLFACVLLAILLVALAAIVLMRQNVMNSFSDYAVGIELDRLDELSGSLAHQYSKEGSWDFIKQDGGSSDTWIVRELARLQRERTPGVPPVPPAPPAPPIAPVAPVPPASPLPPAAGNGTVLPPLPPPVVPGAPPPLAAPPRVDSEPTPLVNDLQLPERVSLVDAANGYLAGLPFHSVASVRRPIVVDKRIIGYLEVAKAARPSDAMSEAFLERVADSVPLIVAASVLLSAVAAVLLASHFNTPITRLASGARALADGNYGTRLSLARSDELGDLADSFNELAIKLDTSEASRRQWVADTSHELRTPLSVLRAQLEAIQDGVRQAGPESTSAMLRQVLMLNKLIDELYTLARADVGELDIEHLRLDLWQLACEQADAFGERFAQAGVALTLGDAPAAIMVSADPDRLCQVLSNLFENCIRYCPAGARVTLTAQLNTDDAAVIVDDNGPGVPDEALARLGERFYRVEGSRSREHGGAGLGLALCRRIVAAHGGQLLFARSPQGGLQARLQLPRATP